MTFNDFDISFNDLNDLWTSLMIFDDLNASSMILIWISMIFKNSNFRSMILMISTLFLIVFNDFDDWLL